VSGSAYLLCRAADKLRERLRGAEATHGMGHDKHTGYIAGLVHAIRELEEQAEQERARVRGRQAGE